MMNGCLMANGYSPITVLNQNSEEFHRIGDFMLQKVEAVLNNVLEIFGRRDK